MPVRRMMFAVGLLGLVLGTGSAGADTPAPAVQGPWLGVWKLNVEKSNFQAGKPPAGTVRTYAMTAAGPDSFDILIDSKTPEGVQTMHMELKGGKFDDKDYRDVGNPIADSNRFKLTGKRSYEFVETKKGVPIMKVTVDISADGKTRTSHQQGVGPDGKPTMNVAVWDRQDQE